MGGLTLTEATVTRVRSPAPRAEWQALAEADPTSLVDQTPAWTEALVATAPYRDVSRLYELSDGRRFVLPLVRRRGTGTEASFPDGWGIGGLVGPGRDEAAIRAVLTDLQGRPELATRVRPDPVDGTLWAAAAPPGLVTRPRRAHVIDLRPGLDGLWDSLHKSTRRNVKHGQKAGLRVTSEATPEALRAYYHLYERSLERWAERSREPVWLARWRGRRRDPLSKLETMAEALGEGFRLWLAWVGDQPAAGSIVLLGNTAHGTRGAIDRDLAAPTRASFLLEWLAIGEAIDHGCERYHLGETGTSASLATFKEGFGGRSHVYADYRIERLPVTRVDELVRAGVKAAVGFRDG